MSLTSRSFFDSSYERHDSRQQPNIENEGLDQPLISQNSSRQSLAGEEKKTSGFMSALHIVNVSVGAGILSLPFVIMQFGIILGSAAIVLCFVVTFISCNLLLKVGELSGEDEYDTIGRFCFKETGFWISRITLVLNNFGLCIMYFVAFSNVGCNIVIYITGDQDKFYCQQWFLTIIGFGWMLFSIFIKDLSKLNDASIVAALATAVFLGVLIEYYINSSPESKHDVPIFIPLNQGQSFDAVLLSLTFIINSFSFQFQYFPIYKNLEGATSYKMKKVTMGALVFILALYLFIAYFGAVMIGSSSEGLLFDLQKILKESEFGGLRYIIINFAFLFLSILGWPLTFLATKKGVFDTIKLMQNLYNDRRRRSVGEGNDLEQDQNVSRRSQNSRDEVRDYVFTLVLFLAAATISLAVVGVNNIGSFIGSTTANGLYLALPPAFYLKLGKTGWKVKIITSVLLLCAFVLLIGGLIASVALWRQTDK